MDSSELAVGVDNSPSRAAAERSRRSILMPVFTPIENDGRVERAAGALSAYAPVTVFCLPPIRGSNGDYPFQVIRAAVPRTHRWRIRRHLRFALDLIACAKALRPAAVYTHDFLAALPGWLASTLSGARLIYDAHELLVPDHGAKRSNRDLFFYHTEKFVMRRADLIIAASDERAQIMQSHYSLATRPTAVRNIPPPHRESPSRSEILATYPLLRRQTPGEVLVTYEGHISLERGLLHLVRALALLDSRFRLIFIGTGPGVTALQSETRRAGISGRTHFLGMIPQPHIIPALRECDIGVISYSSSGLNNQYCAPNKLVEYPQAGIPFVASSQEPIQKVIAHYPVAELFDVRLPPGELPGAIAAAIRQVADNPEKYRRAIPALLTSLSWDHDAQILRDSVDRMLSRT